MLTGVEVVLKQAFRINALFTAKDMVCCYENATTNAL